MPTVQSNFFYEHWALSCPFEMVQEREKATIRIFALLQQQCHDSHKKKKNVRGDNTVVRNVIKIQPEGIGQSAGCAPGRIDAGFAGERWGHAMTLSQLTSVSERESCYAEWTHAGQQGKEDQRRSLICD
jgi:hypothetical protein